MRKTTASWNTTADWMRKTSSAENSKKARKPKRTPFAVSPPSETIDDRSEERQQRQKEEEQQRQREEKKKWGRTIGATRGMYNHPLFLHTMRYQAVYGALAMHQTGQVRRVVQVVEEAWCPSVWVDGIKINI